LRNRPSSRLSAAPAPRPVIQVARNAPIWKKITIGTFADSIALLNELDVAGCNVGGQASEILARPTFTLGSHKTDVDLVAVSPAELGFTSDTVTLAAVYARARQLGFALAAAEVGPQLRLQYIDQPMGEFLIVGMDPIETWSGESIILNVANGGAGLILIGQDGRAGAKISATLVLFSCGPGNVTSTPNSSIKPQHFRPLHREHFPEEVINSAIGSSAEVAACLTSGSLTHGGLDFIRLGYRRRELSQPGLGNSLGGSIDMPDRQVETAF
jgi:hypothetical protein